MEVEEEQSYCQNKRGVQGYSGEVSHAADNINPGERAGTSAGHERDLPASCSKSGTNLTLRQVS